MSSIDHCRRELPGAGFPGVPRRATERSDCRSLWEARIGFHGTIGPATDLFSTCIIR